MESMAPFKNSGSLHPFSLMAGLLPSTGRHGGSSTFLLRNPYPTLTTVDGINPALSIIRNIP